MKKFYHAEMQYPVPSCEYRAKCGADAPAREALGRYPSLPRFFFFP